MVLKLLLVSDKGEFFTLKGTKDIANGRSDASSSIIPETNEIRTKEGPDD